MVERSSTSAVERTIVAINQWLRLGVERANSGKEKLFGQLIRNYIPLGPLV